jgi:hypothetical protein
MGVLTMFIPKSVFPIVSCAAKESSRYSTNGVYLERWEGKAAASVTDGRVLVTTTWDDTGLADADRYPGDTSAVAGWSRILPVDGWKQAEKLLPRGRHETPVLHVAESDDDTTPTIDLATVNRAGNCSTQTIETCEGQFPKYREIIPNRAGDDIRFVVNPKMLANTLATIAKMTADTAEDVPVCLSFDRSNPGNHPVMIETTNRANGQAITALVMPIGLDKSHRIRKAQGYYAKRVAAADEALGRDLAASVALKVIRSSPA